MAVLSPTGFKAPFLPASLHWRLLSLCTYPAAGEEFQFSVFGLQIPIITTNHSSPRLLRLTPPLHLGTFSIAIRFGWYSDFFIYFTTEGPGPQAKMSLVRRNIPPRLLLVSANFKLPSA